MHLTKGRHDMMTTMLKKTAAMAAAVMALGASTGAEEIPDDPFFTLFEDLDPAEWYISDFARKKPSFLTAWVRDQVHLTDDGQLQLSLDPAPEGDEKVFYGSEVQRKAYSHYGRYEVVMTAGRGEGVISAFFTYTGPWFDDPWDEIDFEFLGKDTTKVWVTRFADGERLPGQWLDLGFDSAEEPALYAFDWGPEALIWYVNDVEIMRVEAKDRPLPTTPGRIYVSLWGGGEDQKNWSGIAPHDTSTMATYDCISYVPMGETGQQCSDLPRFQYE